MAAIKCDVCGGFFAYGEVSHPDCKPPFRRRATPDDDIPVSADAMVAGAKALGDVLDNMGSMKMGDAAVAIYRAMERVRRAEADAEVIRRSVKQD
jgi:hypothetical protein